MKVKFNKDIKNVCKYINVRKSYDVESVDSSNVFVKDESGEVRPYPAMWVKEWLE